MVCQQVVEIIDAALAAGRSPRLPHQTPRDSADGSLDQADALLSNDLSNMALALSSILASQSLSPQVLNQLLRLVGTTNVLAMHAPLHC